MGGHLDKALEGLWEIEEKGQRYEIDERNEISPIPPKVTEAEAEYDRLDDELCDMVGAALDARDRGDGSEFERVMGEAESFWKGPHAVAKRRLRDLGGNPCGLIVEESGELTLAGVAD